MRLANIWRHPIKGVGREELASVTLSKMQCLPYDRHWAIAHERAKLGEEKDGWARCVNFARAARGYQLMAVSSHFDEATETITLSHPELPDLVINPDADGNALVEWVSKISDPDRAMPSQVVRADRGMTDSRAPTVSIHSLASLESLSSLVGQPLDQRRFRGNLWFDGPKAYEEFDWVGQKLRIGEVELEIVDRIERCMATTVNPDTGQSDAPTLKTLNHHYDHQDFGVFGIVTKGGQIAVDDIAEVV